MLRKSTTKYDTVAFCMYATVFAFVPLLSNLSVAEALDISSFSATTPLIITRPLYVGAYGKDVYALQQFLKNLGYFKYPTMTGYFGSVTREAVAAFQKDNGVDPIGMVGPKTRALLAHVLHAPVDTPTGYLSVDPPYATVKVGESVQVKAMFTEPRPKCLDAVPTCKIAERAPYQVDAVFASDNASVAEINQAQANCYLPQGGANTCPPVVNFIRGISSGTATITATYIPYPNAYTAQMKVAVVSQGSQNLPGVSVAADTTPPTIPTSLTAAAITRNQVSLSWTASGDNVGVLGYVIFRDSARIATIRGTSTTYSDMSASSATSYTYTVAAYDTAGNISSQSSPVSATTQAPASFDFSLSTPLNASVTQGSSVINSITASLESGTTASVSFSASGLPSGATSSFSPLSCTPACTSTFTISAPASTPVGTYTIAIAGTKGFLTHTTSFVLTVSATPIPADTAPPSIPANLSASPVSSSQINLSWTTSTDNVAVTGYKVYRGGSLIASPGNTTSYSDTGLSPSTNYTYTVAAYDAAGNISAQSAPYSISTAPLLSQLQANYIGLKQGVSYDWTMPTFTSPHAEVAAPDLDPNTFAPTGLNIDSWLDAAVAGGFKYVMFTAKAEDGFAMWPSAYNYPTATNPAKRAPYSIAQTSWYAANGSPDVVGLFVAKARTRGLVPVLYYGIRDKTRDARTGTTEATDPNGNISMIESQLRELLTNYGPIAGIWTDSWGWIDGYVNIPYATIRNYITSISPNTVLVENNHAWPLSNSDIATIEGAPYFSPSGSRYPSESIYSIRTDGTWYYDPAADQSSTALVPSSRISAEAGILNSFGINILVGVTPTRAGVLPPAQSAILSTTNFTAHGTNVALGMPVTTSSTYPRPGTTDIEPSNLTDGLFSNGKFWGGNTGDNAPYAEIDLGTAKTLRFVRLLNRLDCGQPCRDYAKDFTVTIYNASHALIYTSAVINPGNALNGPEMFDVSVPATNGRYVRITGAHQNLGFEEVQVFTQ